MTSPFPCRCEKPLRDLLFYPGKFCVGCGTHVNSLETMRYVPRPETTETGTHCEHRHGPADEILIRICAPGFGLSATIGPKTLKRVLAALTDPDL